ncbi:MAG: hypothetical protein ABJ370_19540 [Paracoccaceae bacterium]
MKLEFKSAEDVKRWTDGRKLPDKSTLLARSAMRTLAGIGTEPDATIKRIFYSIMRGGITLATHSVQDSRTFEAQEQILKLALEDLKGSKMGDDAIDSMTWANQETHGAFSELIASIPPSTSIEVPEFFPEKLSEMSRDAAELQVARTSHDIFELTLWEFQPTKLYDNAITGLFNYCRLRPEREFWVKWYTGILEGKPLDWEMQQEIVCIPDQVWRNADWPRSEESYLSEHVKLIEAKHELLEKISDLQISLSSAYERRSGIGGNFPPETIDLNDKFQIDTEKTRLELDALDHKLREKPLNKSQVQQQIEKVTSQLKDVLIWLAKKNDLAVDTAIKWAIPAAGGGYIAVNPEKFEAVVRGATKLLELLP